MAPAWDSAGARCLQATGMGPGLACVAPSPVSSTGLAGDGACQPRTEPGPSTASGAAENQAWHCSQGIGLGLVLSWYSFILCKQHWARHLADAALDCESGAGAAQAVLLTGDGVVPAEHRAQPCPLQEVLPGPRQPNTKPSTAHGVRCVSQG